MILVKDGGQTLQGLCDKYGDCCSGILQWGKETGLLAESSRGKWDGTGRARVGISGWRMIERKHQE